MCRANREGGMFAFGLCCHEKGFFGRNKTRKDLLESWVRRSGPRVGDVLGSFRYAMNKCDIVLRPSYFEEACKGGYC